MPDELSLCEDILFHGDYQESRSVCVAHVSRIIVCPLGRAGVAPRISVFSISLLKFSQSTRRADWNSRKKNVSYAPGDSSKYFRQLPFLFHPLFLSVSASPAPRANEVKRIVTLRPTKRAEGRGETRIAWTIRRLLLCYAEQPHEHGDRCRRSVVASQRTPSYLSSKRSASTSMIPRTTRKRRYQTDFVIAKPAAETHAEYTACRHAVAGISHFGVSDERTDAYYAGDICVRIKFGTIASGRWMIFQFASTKVSSFRTATGPSFRWQKLISFYQVPFYYSRTGEGKTCHGRQAKFVRPRRTCSFSTQWFNAPATMLREEGCRGGVRRSIKIIARGLTRRDARERAISRSVSRLVVVRCQFRGK